MLGGGGDVLAGAIVPDGGEVEHALTQRHAGVEEVEQAEPGRTGIREEALWRSGVQASRGSLVVGRGDRTAEVWQQPGEGLALQRLALRSAQSRHDAKVVSEPSTDGSPRLTAAAPSWRRGGRAALKRAIDLDTGPLSVLPPRVSGSVCVVVTEPMGREQKRQRHGRRGTTVGTCCEDVSGCDDKTTTVVSVSETKSLVIRWSAGPAPIVPRASRSREGSCERRPRLRPAN